MSLTCKEGPRISCECATMTETHMSCMDLQALQVIPGVTAFFFNDDKALGAESDALPQNGSQQRLLNGIEEGGWCTLLRF